MLVYCGILPCMEGDRRANHLLLSTRERDTSAMVLASSVDSVLDYLSGFPDYSIWRSTLRNLRDAVEASDQEQVLFAASSNEACTQAGFPSGALWAARDPASFLFQIIALPRCWPSAPVRMFCCDTLATNDDTGAVLSVFMRVSPESFMLPSHTSDIVCDKGIPRPNGCALALRSYFLPLTWDPLPTRTLQDAIDSQGPDLSLFSRWLVTAGLGLLPASPGPYTLMAPTNAAFEALAQTLNITAEAFVSTPALSCMAYYHVISGLSSCPTNPGGPPVSSVASDGFLVSFQTVVGKASPLPRVPSYIVRYANTARVQDSSETVDNGVLYIIDAVLGHGQSGPYPACSPFSCN